MFVFSILEIQTDAYNGGYRPRVDVAINAACHLRINSSVICNGEHILYGGINTSAKCSKEFLETVT